MIYHQSYVTLLLPSRVGQLSKTVHRRLGAATHTHGVSNNHLILGRPYCGTFFNHINIRNTKDNEVIFFLFNGLTTSLTSETTLRKLPLPTILKWLPLAVFENLFHGRIFLLVECRNHRLLEAWITGDLRQCSRT